MRRGIFKIIVWQIFFAAVTAVIIRAVLTERTPADIPLDVIEAEFDENYAVEGMQKAGAMRIKRAYGVNASDYADYIYYAPSDTMDVNEFFMVKVTDEAQKKEVVKAMEYRLNEQKKIFDGYGTDQIELLEKARIFSEGNYVCFMVSSYSKAWLNMIKDKIEVK
ncbi:MAG: DUF4358 domain-containing protein [Butyrivibrio sp.]|nr:DUF4358 domain-containing protein [Butyrivibrio sp.]